MSLKPKPTARLRCVKPGAYETPDGLLSVYRYVDTTGPNGGKRAWWEAAQYEQGVGWVVDDSAFHPTNTLREMRIQVHENYNPKGGPDGPDGPKSDA
jgi:hypothetical protein